MTFAKGLGGHAHSEQAYHLGGRCSRVWADAGDHIDNDHGDWADAQVACDP